MAVTTNSDRAAIRIAMTPSRDERQRQEIVDREERLLDPVQSAMGAMGRWHIWVCAVIFLLKFPVAWHQMVIIFLAPRAAHECATPNVTEVCSAECQSVEYDRSVFTETIITEWDLICERKELAKISQTIVMSGILAGNIIFGWLSDRFGRRKPLVFAVFLQLILGVATAFIPWFWVFLIFKFLTALATGGMMIPSFVLGMEIIGVKWRELYCVLYQLPFYLGHLTLALFAYYLRDWHHLQLAISLPSVVLISYYWLIPESPRWLFALGKIEKSSIVLAKAAKQNRLPTENIKADLEEALLRKKKDRTEEEHKQGSRGTIVDLFRTPNMRKKTVFMCFNWFVVGLAFFGVSQYVGQIGGNIFANVAIGASLELPGTVICIILMKYAGRKKTLIASNTLTGISMLCIAFVPKEASWAIVSLSSAGIVGMSISFPTVYLYGGELFPTVVRNVGVGLASMIARIGSMLAPFVAETDVEYVPPIIFGLVPLIGAVLVFWLPETRGQPLPETIEDGENFGKKLHEHNSDRKYEIVNKS